jgi:hypothetical protein
MIRFVCLQVDRVNPQQYLDWLLQLPKPALHLVLQQLDPCTLACTAVTCSTLAHACVSTMSKAKVCCSTPQALENFTNWLQQQSSSLSSLTECSIVSTTTDKQSMRSFPCPQLHKLHLSGLEVQLGLAGGFPGVLQDCTGLTALHLQDCVVLDAAAAPAALAALPHLQSLSLAEDSEHKGLLPDLQRLSQLTYLSLKLYSSYDCTAEDVAWLSQLSALVNLQHLELTELPKLGVPGGLPSQLVKLTSLRVDYGTMSCDTTAEQLQHLSSLTALQQLSVKSFYMKSAACMRSTQADDPFCVLAGRQGQPTAVPGLAPAAAKARSASGAAAAGPMHPRLHSCDMQHTGPCLCQHYEQGESLLQHPTGT